MKNKIVLSLISSVLCSAVSAQNENSPTFIPTFGIGTEVTDYPNVQWIQGTPVTSFDKNKIYIIECWATWCGPCKAAIPHINQLHEKFGEKVQIIGQDIFETNIKRVKEFVEGKGDKMNYSIAYGGGYESDFSLKWMKAGGFNGIPQTIVIQQNKVVWTPHPNELSEGAVQLLIDNKFTLEAVKKLHSFYKYEGIRNMILKDKKYKEAMVQLDSVLVQTPCDVDGIMIKWSLYKLMEQPELATSYLKQAYEQQPASILRPMYFTTLQNNSQWDLLSEEAKAYLQKNKKDNEEAAEVMIAWYHALIGSKNFKGAAELLNKFVSASESPGTLSSIALVNKKAGIVHDAIREATFKAGIKSIGLDPVNLPLIVELVKVSWTNNDQAGAKSLCKKAIALLKKDGSQSKMLLVVNQLFDLLEKGILPTDQEFKAWDLELKK